jgi:allantoinase
MDLIIKNGKVVDKDNNLLLKTIAIKNGKIAGIYDPNEQVEGEKYIDATGLTILPGAIDSHVHFKEPAKDPDNNENFYTGTMAAASGGITSVMEMPNSFPCTYNKELLVNRKNILKNRSFIDYGLYGATGRRHFHEIEELAEEGIIAFKSFMHEPPSGREDDFEGFTMTSESDMYQAFDEIRKTGKPIALHGEDSNLLNYFIDKVQLDRKENTYEDHITSRPVVVEVVAIQKVILFSKLFDVPVICVHVSSPEALELIRKAKEDGLKVYAETCPHYLLFDDDLIRTYGSFAKCNPPLRDRERVEKMWSYVNDGTVDIISSDHSPHIRKPVNDILKAPGGFPGTELLLPLMLDQVNKDKLTLRRLIEMISINPAKIFKLYPRKGSIEPGTDADLTIVDMNVEKTVDSSNLLSFAASSGKIYDGLKVKGWPEFTIVRGQIISQKGVVDKECEGKGCLVVPE